MTSRVDKGSMKCNTPRRTPNHPTKSHVVKACADGKEKIIHFGQQGVKGSPKKAGESESYRKRRESFKARHAKNIAKGKMSAAYWANRVKWAEGGSVNLKDYPDPYADRNVIGKIGSVAAGLIQGGKYLFSEPDAFFQHGDAPEQLAELLKKYPEMGAKRTDRGPLDAAVNYAGAYDWAMRPEVSPEDARSMAYRYQLADSMWPTHTPSNEFADYWQNMAGVEQALKDREAGVVRKRSEIVDLARKYAAAEQQAGRVMPQGMLEPGNIDVSKRPVVKNKDGSISTVRSIGINVDGREMLIPTVVNGRVVSDKEALEHYRKTGEHLGRFATQEDSDRYGAALHQSEEQRTAGAAKYDPKKVGSIVQKFAKGGSAKAEETDPVEAEVEKQFGMKPGLDRATLLPFAGRRSEGNLQWAVPGAIYDLAKAYVLPGMAAQGYQVTPEQSVQFAGNLLGGAGVGSSIAPVEGTLAGMAIKNKGGNWIKNATKKILDPIRPLGPTNRDEALSIGDWWTQGVDTPRGILMINQNAALHGAFDKLDKYMRNEMGTVHDPLIKQADEWAVKQKDLLAKKDAQLANARDKLQRAQQERGVTPEMLTESQARIRDLQKERDYINEQKGLHYDPPRGPAMRAQANREMAGMPTDPQSVSPYARAWENASDAAVNAAAPYRLQIPIIADRESAMRELDKLGGNYALDNPNALAYSLNRGVNAMDLGFSHLIDELYNVMTPDSGLPTNLLRSPEQVQKMTLPQMVKLVDEVNAWRAIQKAEVNAARAGNAATHTVKEYPEAGMKWVELKTPDYKNMPLEDRREMVERLRKEAAQKGINPEDYIEDYPKAQLADALKYEGDIMKHCVGGYCPDVILGKSRIFSLRDSSGKPYATIEVKPSDVGRAIGDLPDAERAALVQKVNDEHFGGVMPGRTSEDNFFDLLDKAYLEKYGDPPASIKQIKGPNNRKPDPSVIPMVQDFVKSGQWTDVKDIKNSELFKVSQGQKLPGFSKEIAPGYYTIDDFKKMAAENEMPQEILDSWMNKLQNLWDFDQYAAGGSVKSKPKNIQDMVAKYEKGGSVDPVELEVKKQFGMEPGLDRATFLPFAGRRSEGNLEWAVPGSIYDLAKAYVMPGMATEGYVVSPEEASLFAGNLMGGAGTASSISPVEGTIAGMAAKRAKKTKEYPLLFPEAKPFDKAKIEQMAERITRQMEGIDTPNTKTLKQAEREKDLTVDILEDAKKRELPIIDYASKKGSYLIGVPGDPSIGGMIGREGLESPQAAVSIAGIGERKFDRPVGQFGGKDYGTYDHPYGWAGNISGVRPLSNASIELNKLYPEAPIIGQFVKMTPESLNFAVHNLDTLLAYQRPDMFPKKYKAQLTKMIRDEPYRGFPAYPEFSGFDDPAELLLAAKQNSDLRKKIVAVLSKKSVLPPGTPPVEDVYFAVSHPELRNLETGASGSTILSMDPHTDPLSLISPHPTYAHELPSTVIGQSRYMAPIELAFPRSMSYAIQQIENLPAKKRKSVQPFNMAKMIGLREPIDQQYIDQLGEYELQMKKKLGYKKGGLAQVRDKKASAIKGSAKTHKAL